MPTASTNSIQFHQTIVGTNGVQLNVVQAGPNDGPLLVLLHGFPEFGSAWHRQIAYLAARGYWVWAPDQRGYNLSEKPPSRRDYNSQALLDDAVGLIEAAGRQRATFIGHDWGGIVVWWLAECHPERLAGAVVLNAPHPTVFVKYLRSNPRQMLRSSYAAFFQLPWLPERLLRQKNWQRLVQALCRSSREGTFSEADLLSYRESWSRPGAMTGMLNWYRAARHQPQSCTSRVAVPLRLLWGRRDVFLGAELAERSISVCDAGHLIDFPEATHWLHHEEPQRVNALIEAFLRDIEPRFARAGSKIELPGGSDRAGTGAR